MRVEQSHVLIPWDPAGWRRTYARAWSPSWMVRWRRAIGWATLAMLIVAYARGLGVLPQAAWFRPGFMFLALLGVYVVCCRYGARHARRVLSRREFRACARCGYDTEGLSSPGVCPECALPFERESLERFWLTYVALLDARRREAFWIYGRR